MSNKQITRKEIYANFGKQNVYYTGRDEFLKEMGFERDGYFAGVLGWNADIFYFGSIVVCAGYRPFGGRELDHELLERYAHKATEIMRNEHYSKHERLLRRVRGRFLNELRKLG